MAAKVDHIFDKQKQPHCKKVALATQNSRTDMR